VLTNKDIVAPLDIYILLISGTPYIVLGNLVDITRSLSIPALTPYTTICCNEEVVYLIRVGL